MSNRTSFRVFLLVALCQAACQPKTTELRWTQSFYNMGSQSSPRATDLNGDGVLDIVMGAGKEETAECEQGVIALDGQTGDLLWQVASSAHVVGSPTFLDVNGDGTDDVLIGGRAHFLVGIDGRTGTVLWSYDRPSTDDPVLRYAHFNFYNSVAVPDQNGDGIRDLLIVNGGNWDAAPFDTLERYPGVLMVLDPVNGHILAADTMPDGKESYMSPICFQQPGSDRWQIVFGTGGETIGGSLYRADLASLMSGRLREAQPLATENGHGFIAPPAVLDVTGDGQYELAAISHASRLSVIDLDTEMTLWSKAFAGMETSSSFGVGCFNTDETPDVMITMSRGTWPHYAHSLHVVLDGRTGAEIFSDSLGCFSLSTPAIYDFDGDGLDDALISVNQYDCSFTLTEDSLTPPDMSNLLLVLDMQSGATQVVDRQERFRNIFSTPWLGDLDGDGHLDIVYSQYFNAIDIRRYLGMSIKRIDTHIRCQQPPRWGGYMGSGSNGVFPI